MKQTGIIATAVTAATAVPSTRDCCTPMSSFATKKPQVSWICGPLRNKYQTSVQQCKTDVDSFFADLGTTTTVGPNDVNLAETKLQIKQWFDYYCGEEQTHEDRSEKSEKSEKSLKSEKSEKSKKSKKSEKKPKSEKSAKSKKSAKSAKSVKSAKSGKSKKSDKSKKSKKSEKKAKSEKSVEPVR